MTGRVTNMQRVFSILLLSIMLMFSVISVGVIETNAVENVNMSNCGEIDYENSDVTWTVFLNKYKYLISGVIVIGTVSVMNFIYDFNDI